jgi:site-specific recombinase XerD
MDYRLQNVYDPSLPEVLNEFLNYLGTIKGKSKNTIEGYKIDLTMFFKFIMLYRGVCKEDVEFEDIYINQINIEFVKKIKLADLYAFISFAENYRGNGNYARARKVASLKSFFKYLSGKAKAIDENPAIELESPKINKRNPVYLTLEESKLLLDSIEGKNKERDYCIITLFLNC